MRKQEVSESSVGNMITSRTYECKKCGDKFPNLDYKHYSICRNTNTTSEYEILDSYRVCSYRMRR